MGCARWNGSWMNLKVAPASVEVKMIPPRLSNTGMSAVSITWKVEPGEDDGGSATFPKTPKFLLTELPGPTLTPNSSRMNVLLILWEISWKDFPESVLERKRGIPV